MDDPVDGASTRAWEQLAEYQALLGLLTDRLFDLQRDFEVLRDEMVRCHAMLGALPTGPELPCQEQSADIWGDQTPA